MIKKFFIKLFHSKKWIYENYCKKYGHQDVWVYGPVGIEMRVCHDCDHDDVQHFHEFHIRRDNYGNC